MSEVGRRATVSPPESGPFQQAPAATLAPEAREPDARMHPPGCVLIVEDEYLVALVIEDALAFAGFAVAGVAETADQAVMMAGTTRPDIVLMDIRLRSGRDGIDAAREILQRFGIPSVFVTAQADPGTRQRGEEEAHPLGWLLKPFALNELTTTVSAAVALARGRRGGA